MRVPCLFISSRQNAELNPYREWAVAELRSDVFPTFLQVWRFEDEPASGREPEAIFLDGVASSDVVMFIAGSNTSDATATEISAAIDHGQDILCLVLPSDARDVRVNDLISRVRAVSATTKDVALDEASFRIAVAAAARAWLIGRIQGGPTQNRRAKLEARFAESEERTVELWLSADLDEDLSRTLAKDPNIGTPPDNIIPTPDRPFVIVAAPVGSGKSITLERLFQVAVRAAQTEVLAPVPVRLAAYEIIGSLKETVEHAMTGLGGSLPFNGVALFVDGLDEVDEARGSQVVRDSYTLRNAYPKSRVVLAGRHAPDEHMVKFVTQLPLLSLKSALALMQQVGGEEGRAAHQRASGAIAEAIRRPLFAIVLARNTMASVASESDVAGLLIAKALTLTERATTTSGALQGLAAKILDSAQAGVKSSEITPLEQQELLKTRLVFEDSGFFRIPLRVVAERAASQWLSLQPVEIALAKALADGSSDRWRTSITDYVRALSDEAAVSFVLAVAVQDPVLAMQTAKADKTPRSLTWDGATLKQTIQKAEAILESAFPKLYAAEPSRLFVEDIGGAYIVKRERLAGDGRVESTTTYLRHSWDGRHSAFVFAIEHLVTLLDDRLSARSFTVSDPTLDEEVLWNSARILLSLSTLADKAIALDAIEKRLAILPIGTVMAQGSGARLVSIDTRPLRARVAALRDSGATTWTPPFVPGDQTGGTWVWSTYSNETLLRKRREATFNALRAYVAIVDLWLPALRSRLEKRVVMPAIVREHVDRANNGEPVFSQYRVPLRLNDESNVEITLGPQFAFADIVSCVQQAIETNRPLQRSRISVSMKNGRIRMWSPLPVREMTYRWLHEDLKKLTLSKHVGLPREMD